MFVTAALVLSVLMLAAESECVEQRRFGTVTEARLLRLSARIEVDANRPTRLWFHVVGLRIVVG
jgi:hypothetical protein